MPRDVESSEGVPTLEDVYRAHAAAVSRWAERLGGPSFDVEDAVHDVFMVVQRRLPEFRGEARLSTWLYEITFRVVQAKRRSARLRRLLWPFSQPEGTVGRVTGDSGWEPPDRALARRQDAALLYRLLDELDEKYRTAIVLFEIEGKGAQEIAALTGTSTANVWVRLSRAREKLAEAYRKHTRGDEVGTRA